MIDMSRVMNVQVDVVSSKMVVTYAPQTDRTIYDLCDLNGRVIKTGSIETEETILDISGLSARGYVMLIVDGDQVISKRVSFAA